MKKIIIISLLALLGSTSVTGQQISLNTMYSFNDFIVNPAVAGSREYIPVTGMFRRQWTGIDGAPVTQLLSTHAYVGSNLGLGGYIFNDVTGPTRRTGINVSAAYHLQLSRDRMHVLSMGLAGVFFQHTYQKDKLTTDEPDDIAIINANNNELVPDANFGLYYYYADKAYFGVSAFNLIQTRMDLFDAGNPFRNQIMRTYYVTGGYNFEIGDDFAVKPSFLLQTMESTPMQLDLTAKFLIKNVFWLGASYRNKDAVAAMLGLTINRFSFGYAYDITISDIKNYSSGSHELCLSYYFMPGKASKRSLPWNKRNRLFSPIY